MKLGLIGEVLGHSLSPDIHERLFQKQHIESSYDLIEIPREGFGKRLEEVLDAYDGLNVTIPYKLDVMPFLDEISEEAKAIGAVNTIAKISGKRKGYNTDYFGFQQTVDLIGAHVKGQPVDVLGHGGASRAVIQYLYDKGASEIRVVSRHPEKVDAGFAAFAKERKVTLWDYETLEKEKPGALLVNATPVGMYPKTGVSPISKEKAETYSKVIDLIYNPAKTQLLLDAKKADTANGMYMLVMQAMAAEEIWMQQKIPQAVSLEIAEEMRR